MFESALEPESVEPFPPLRNAWYLSGATAAGKTAVALEVADMIQAEIISLDSMSVFQEMNIGTAKPSLTERQRIPHYGINVVAPTQDFSLAEFVQLAHTAAENIRQRGKQVMLVGGTPLYLKSLLRGLNQGPPPDWEFRKAVENDIAQYGLPALRERLQVVDPLSAAKLHPHDQRRMIRALEVYKLTGFPISHLQTQFDEVCATQNCQVFVLSWPRATLHARIDARVDSMFANGFVEEVESLLAKYGTLSRTAQQAVGYCEVAAYLAGTKTLSETIEQVKFATHRFARRQETWFRSLSECIMLPQTEPMNVHEVAATIVKAGKIF
jgi:tRNA dimethylallyltransferase